MNGFLSAPIFLDVAKTERAATFFAVAWQFFGITAIALSVLIAFDTPQIANLASHTLLIFGLVTAACLEANRRGRTTEASSAFIGILLLHIAYRSYLAGGVSSLGASIFYVFALMGGLLLGFWAGIGIALCCAIYTLILAILQMDRLMPQQTIHYAPLTAWWLECMYMAIVITLMFQAIQSIKKELFERRKAEAGAVDAKFQLETLIAKAGIGVLIHRDFKPIVVNSELARIMGLSETELLHVEDIRQSFDPTTRDRVNQIFESRVHGDHSTKVTGLRCKRRDEWVELESRSFPIDWEGAAATCAMITDVTQQRKLEAELRQSQRLEGLGRLTGGVAHDFNNLLTVIVGSADHIQNFSGAETPVRESASLILKAAESGAELTHRLLAYSRQQPLKVQTVDINQLVAGLRELLQRTLGEQFEIKTILSNELWHTRVDVGEFEHAILNLAVNARDAMPSGGRLTIETKNLHLSPNPDDALSSKRLDPDELHPGDYVLIEVSDTGAGMDDNTLRNAFEPFFTTKGVGKGSGLGLSMVYGFVRQLGGHVRICSEVGHGTTVKLYLPGEKDAVLNESPKPEKVMAVGGPENILLVEDNDLVREQATIQLQRLGYSVHAASHGQEAVQILKTVRGIQLLFTDVVMPNGISGYELALEARKIVPELPILFTSGYSEEWLKGKEFLGKRTNLIVKPYNPKDLSAKIRELLDS